MKRPVLLLLLSLALALPVLAGGSTYSRYGYGDLLLFGGTRSFSMGGTGIGLIGDGFINLMNPAGLSKIANPRFSGSLYYNQLSSQASEGTSDFSNFGFQGFALAVPISKDNGFVISVEMTPLSKISYSIEQSLTQLGIASTQTLYGSGGLSKLALAASYAPTEDLFAGLRLNYNFGRIRQYVKVNFTDANYVDTEIDRSTFISGYTATLGFMATNVGSWLGVPSLRKATFGAVLTTPVNLLADQNVSYTAIETTITTSHRSSLPLAIGVGGSYLVGERYLVAGDLSMQNWSSASVLGTAGSNLRNSFQAGAGLEILPERLGDTYWKRVAYRVGAGYHQTYYNINGIGINEFFVTGGLGLPLAPDSRLNLGLQIGFRGTTDNNLQKDTIIRFSVGIAGSELWFMRIEEE